MGLAVAGSNLAAATLALTHAIFSWPLILGISCPPGAWRLLPKTPLRQALRIESEASFLNFRMAHYGTARMIENLAPAGGKVFSYSGAPEAYTSRDILVAYQSAFGNVIGDILWTPLIPDVEPRWLLRFRYPGQSLRQIRVVQTAARTPDQWRVSELRIVR